MNKHQRIFCIGMNKTGISSVIRCLQILDVAPVVSLNNPAPSLEASVYSILNDYNYEPMLEIAKSYRGFVDRPWNVWEAYKHLDRRYPR